MRSLGKPWEARGSVTESACREYNDNNDNDNNNNNNTNNNKDIVMMIIIIRIRTGGYGQFSNLESLILEVESNQF